MNKSELNGRIAEATGESSRTVGKIISSFLSLIKDELQRGRKVQLADFGTFEIRERAARQGTNPQTGERISIPACKIPYFKVSKNFKAAVN